MHRSMAAFVLTELLHEACGTTDPTAWKIVDGKLYLITNKDIKMKWEKDIMGNIKKSDENWMMMNKEKSN